MKYVEFEIQNYKGIQKTRIKLSKKRGLVYTLVGLNESGKTTLLESLNHFRPDIKGIHALAQKSINESSIEALVPKEKKDNFNGQISISARVAFEEGDIEKIVKDCRDRLDIDIQIESIPKDFKICRHHKFKNSAHESSTTIWDIVPKIKKGGPKILFKRMVRTGSKLLPR